MIRHYHSLLSREAILGQLGRGVIIDPFDEANLKGCSYDVRIGEWYYRRVAPSAEWAVALFNPYDNEAIKDHFQGPFRARMASELDGYDSQSRSFYGIDPTDRVIVWSPGELILGHTIEFIGGTLDPQSGRCFTAEMKARSSIGRIGFEICRCAGWGDPGYTSRWTMEIKNDDPCATFLVVGTRVAQIKFYEVDPVAEEYLYGFDPNRDHYQTGTDVVSMRAAWKPEMLLPHLSKR